MSKRYKATAVVQWEFEISTDGELNPFKLAHDEIKKHLSHGMSVRIAKVDKCKKRGRSNMVLGEFLPEDVLPYVTNGEERREYQVDGKTYLVRMNSHRYFIFRSSCRCAACGLEGVKMKLEQHPNDKSPHFNLYAVEDEKLVLMTKDHIHAKSCGGDDRHSNYQTMCAICNNLKASSNLTLDAVRHLRKLYDENKDRLSKKKLAALISEARKERELPWPAEKNGCQKKNTVVVDCDINILKNGEGQLFGMSVYESVDKGKEMEHVACVKKGTPLVFVKQDKNVLHIPFNGHTFSLYSGLTNFQETR